MCSYAHNITHLLKKVYLKVLIAEFPTAPPPPVENL